MLVSSIEYYKKSTKAKVQKWIRLSLKLMFQKRRNNQRGSNLKGQPKTWGLEGSSLPQNYRRWGV